MLCFFKTQKATINKAKHFLVINDYYKLIAI